MPKFLEAKLRQGARKRGLTGKAAERYVYGGMNDIGAMKGSKETAKGRAMERKHEAKMNSSPAQPGNKAEKAPKPGPMQMRELRVEIHRGPAPKHAVTGFTVHHHMLPKKTGKMGAFMEHETHTQPFSADEHGAMVDHVAEHLEDAIGNE